MAGRPAQELSLRARALRHLARREFTRHELTQKLAPHAESPAAIEQVLDDFAQRGWLSEQRAAEQLVHARRSRYGIARIRRDLEVRGVSPDLVSATVNGLKAGELDAARAVWRRKFRAPPANAAERARHARFLQGRGFSVEVVSQLLRGLGRAGDSDGENNA